MTTPAPTQTLTVPRASIHRQLRRGDRIVAVDGVPLDRPHVVDRPHIRVGNTHAVALVKPKGLIADWNLYPDSQVGDAVTVERPEPRPAVRVVDGLRLTRSRDGRWVTDDGRYEVAENDGYLGECEFPHPMAVTAEQRAAVRAGRTPVGSAVWMAVKDGRSHYQCEGGEEHAYSRWIVWDNTRGDYAGGPDGLGPGGHDRFKDAAAWLASYVAGAR